MRISVASLVTGLLLIAPVGGSGGSSDASHDPGSPRGIPGSERAPVLTGLSQLGTLAPASSYWTREFRRRWHEARRTTRLQASTIRRLRRELRFRPSTREAIGLAAVTFGVSERELVGLASCESGLNPRARNPSSASGLFQHLYPSTWRTTPYARFSVWSPYASSLAAAYMLAHGRRGEWVC